MPANRLKLVPNNLFSIILLNDPYCHSILNPKNENIYLNISNDKAKLGGWKADGMSWDNKGLTSTNPKSDRLYHLKL